MPLVLPDANHPLRSSLQHNLQNAMHTALLLLPDAFHEETLYQTLAGLSYTGLIHILNIYFIFFVVDCRPYFVDSDLNGSPPLAI